MGKKNSAPIFAQFVNFHSEMIRFFRKYHKWLGVIFTLVILTYGFSGIILNHREALSFADVSRQFLPGEYRYENWNNAAVKSTLKISPDSILIYGNIGIWLTDSTYSGFTNFSAGFPKGIDNRKIFQMIITTGNRLLAGTFSGLYTFNYEDDKWISVKLPVKEKSIADIIQKQDTIFVLTRSSLLKTTDLSNFIVTQLPPPENYDNSAGLFKTFWVIHSGEIYGLAGKIIVDFAGLVFAFLSITGFIIFVNRIILKKNKKPDEVKIKLRSYNRWNIKWHNKLGWITLAILILNTTTGMFLRPPLLAFIGNSRVGKIPHTELATPNPWFDQLRRIYYDQDINRFIVVTMDGLYYSDNNFKTELKPFRFQPPASIMGVTVFEKTGLQEYLVGSFEGLFTWNSETGKVFDYIKDQQYISPTRKSRPIGEFLVSGFTRDYKNHEFFFDYNQGAVNINGSESYAALPQNVINDTPVSLWNVALEIHTGRIYQSVIGDFYVLIVPITGLFVLFILISGFIVWLKVRKS
jgi:hypothetical protein